MILNKAISEQKALIEKLQNQIDNAELWIIYANAKIARGHYDLGFEKDIQNTKIQLELLQSYLEHTEKALRYMKGVEIETNHPVEDIMGTEIVAGDVYYRINEDEVVLEQNLLSYFAEFYDAEKRVAGE